MEKKFIEFVKSLSFTEVQDIWRLYNRGVIGKILMKRISGTL